MYGCSVSQSVVRLPTVVRSFVQSTAVDRMAVGQQTGWSLGRPALGESVGRSFGRPADGRSGDRLVGNISVGRSIGLSVSRQYMSED